MADDVAVCAGTTTTSGTTNPVMTGSVADARTFAAALTNGQEVGCHRRYSSGRAGFENFVGTYNSATNTVEYDDDDVTLSSNGNLRVNWEAYQTTISVVTTIAELRNASKLTSGTVPYARVPIGTTANTVAAADDARFGSVAYDELDTAATLDRSEILALSQGGEGVQSTVGDILDANMYGGLAAAGNAVAEGTVGAFPAIRIVQAWTLNDPSNFIVPDFAAGTLTVPTGGDGAYFVTANIYAYVGSNSKTYTFGIFKNTGPFGLRVASQVTSAGGAGSNVALSGPVDLVAGDVISLYVASSDGGTAMTISYASLFMQRIGA